MFRRSQGGSWIAVEGCGKRSAISTYGKRFQTPFLSQRENQNG